MLDLFMVDEMHLTPVGIWLRRQIARTNIHRADDVPWCVFIITIGERIRFGVAEWLDRDWRYCLRLECGVGSTHVAIKMWGEKTHIYLTLFPERCSEAELK